ncbi:MAG TPA: leucyl aminopeptidase [Terriglobales bacterium]|jgi:leucyl aminopeptidase
MQTQVQFLADEAMLKFETEALVILLPPTAPHWGGESISELYASGEFAGKPMEMALVHRPRGWSARRLLLIGTGDKPGDALSLWRSAGAAARYLKARGVRGIGIVVPGDPEPAAAATALITGVESGNFDPDVYKSDRKPEQQITSLTLLLNSAVTRGPVEQAAREAAAIAAGQRFARELANEPGNRMTPTILGQRAQAMARQAGLECELIDAQRARELKMGSFLAVGQGSVEPPVMIVLRYKGTEGGPTLGIIGKGITFDSGGISIKPAANMDQMKFDMSGGAATLGAMQALAALKPKINLLAIVAAAENMPGGRAQKPGDVQTAMSGKTIEVLNTDAEGRMVLADALHYARQLGVTHLIDSATLTGACVVALGNVNAGVFAGDEAFYQQFEAARRRTGEKMWRLPLDGEYNDQIKGSVGDILNTGGRWGGAITAAAFLEAFVGDTPWIHLDIAGTAWLEENKPWMPKGPTGSPTYTLIELAREMAAGKK